MKEKLLLMAASLLGFATACDQEERTTDMYGTRYNDFRVQGKVTDKAGRPIPGIEVRNDTSPAEKTATDAKGSYTLKSKTIDDNANLRFVDIDGPANGGEFVEKQVGIEFTEADRTVEGYDRSDVNVQLEEKE